MNKKEFLKELSILLNDLPSEERDEILFDYEEHFSIGHEEGKTDKEIIESLGNPRTIAKQYKASYIVNQAAANPSPSNILSAVFATIVLGFFNLVFVLGPFLGVVGILIGLFGASIGIIVGGFSLFLKIALGPALTSLISLPVAFTLNPGASIFLGIGLTSLGLLFLIGNCFLTKWIYIGTIKYLKWNLKMIRR